MFELNSCVFLGQLCNTIHRAPGYRLAVAQHRRVRRRHTQKHRQREKTDGIDINAELQHADQGLGQRQRELCRHVAQQVQVQPIAGRGSYDCADLCGVVCACAPPQFRSKLRGTWNTPWFNTALSPAWRYYDSVDIDASSSNPLLAAPFNPVNGKLDSQNYIDLALSVATSTRTSRCTPAATTSSTRIRRSSALTIAGLAFGNGNTYPQVYDSLGRNFFLSVTAKF